MVSAKENCIKMGILLEVSLRNLPEVTVEILAEVPRSVVPEIASEMYSKIFLLQFFQQFL